jgi:hypothetical protein
MEERITIIVFTKVKLEDEMRGKFFKEYYNLLVENQLEKFEKKLSSYFFASFGKY